MDKIRVLLVDDAVVVRKVLSDILSKDPEIEVVGAAANGKLGLQKLAQLQPDIVVLDIEMPEMDGITALKEIRKQYRKLPVIMFSTLTARGAAATLEALAAGASDYATKPSNTSGIAGAAESLQNELIPKIKALVAPKLQSAAAATPTSASTERSASGRRRADFSGRPPARADANVTLRARSGPAHRVEIVAIGVSTGGPNALAELIPALPTNLGVPVVIVQHMPPTFTQLLAERLDRASGLSVVEGKHGQQMLPNEVYVAPGDYHMTVRREGLHSYIDLNQAPQENSCRPAVDVLYRSVATTFGAGALAVIMTGMGSDGFKGSQLLAQHDAQIIVQDEASSVVWGMPSFVAKAGLAEAVVPLKGLASEIARRTVRPGVAAMASVGGAA